MNIGEDIVWIDIPHPKYAWEFRKLLELLEKKNFKTLITARDGLGILEICKLLKYSNITVVGKYGKSIEEKLIYDIERMREFYNILRRLNSKVIACIGVDSASLRVAYGLKIRTVCVNDTPKNVKLCRLTISISDYLITPRCCVENFKKLYNLKFTKVIDYDGIEERSYITPELVDIKLHYAKRRDRINIVLRDVEYLSSYAISSKVDIVKIIEIIKRSFDNVSILLLARYEEDYGKYIDIKRKFDREVDIIVPRRSLLLPIYLTCVDLVIGSGGTICRESTLLGIPTISFYFWDEQMRYLNKLGFPNMYSRPSQLLENISKIVKDLDRYCVDTRSMLTRMESPLEYIVEIICKLL